MIRHNIPAILLVVLSIAVFMAAQAQMALNINMDSTYQTIHSLGDITYKNNPLNDQVSDLQISNVRFFMDPEYNAGLERTNDNADPNNLDISKFTHAPEYLTRVKLAYNGGTRVFLGAVFSPPTWMKDLSTNAYADQTQWQCPNIPGMCGGTLRTDMYNEFAEWLEGCVLSFRQQAGFDLTCIGIQNEPSFAEPYSSCVYTAAQMRDVIKVVGARFAAKGITTKLLFPEEVVESWGNLRGFITTVCNDTAARKYVGYIGYHGYAPDGVSPGSITPAAMAALGTLGKTYGKPIWMTETSGYPVSMAGAMTVAYGIHSSLAYANASAWTYLNLQKSINTYLYYVHKNFIRYIRPGAIRVKAVSADTAQLMLTAFKNPADSAVTIVILNRKAQQQITINGAGLPATFGVYTTSATQNCVANGTASAVNSYQLTLPASSVTTLRGVVPGGITAIKAVPEAVVTHRVMPKAGNAAVFDVAGRRISSSGKSGLSGTHSGVFVTGAGAGMIRVLNVTK